MNSTVGTSGRVDIQVGSATTSSGQGADCTSNITNQYSGLLDDLTTRQRSGLIAMLSTGYYDGWRPTRPELIRYLQDEYGITSRNHRLSIAEHLQESVDDR